MLARKQSKMGTGMNNIKIRSIYGFLVVGALTCLMSVCTAAAAGKYALVIGVSGYDHMPELPNANRDAALISASLESVGFDVTTMLDPTLDDLNNQQIGGDHLDDGSIFLLYFAGHGVQVLGENFLLFSDAKVDTNALAGFMPLSSILTRLGRTKANTIIVLDSCRNNPLDSSGVPALHFLDKFPAAYASYAEDTGQTARIASRAIGESAGMSRVDSQPPNVLLSYATRAGAISFDGEENTNSPFAAALAEAITTPDIEVTRMFRHVRDKVLAKTEGLQEPFIYGALGGKDVYLHPVDCPCQADPIPKEFFQCQQQAAPSSNDFPQGRNVSGINPEIAIPVCQAALDKAPTNAVLQFWTGRAYTAAREDEKARDHYLVAAQGGIGLAMHNLALLYDGGRNLDFNAKRAQYWFEKAEAKDVIISRSQLAWYFEKGRAGEVDINRAFQLYKKNAEWGETFSQRKLGFLYRLGLGTEISRPDSEYWFRNAAIDGDQMSMYELGNMLTQDDARHDAGIGWLIMGMASGSEDAQKTLNDIAFRPEGDRLRASLIARLQTGNTSLVPSDDAGAIMNTLRDLTNSAWLAGVRQELVNP